MEFRLRVYYEDTDAGGIVYYANYLKFIERARTEALLALGIRQPDLRERLGVVFVVRSVTAEYLAPAVLEDQLAVTTALGEIGGARILLHQDVLRDGRLLVKCRVTLACMALNGRPARIPPAVAAALSQLPDVSGPRPDPGRP